MRCKNKTCMFIHLERGCCDDESCDGFVQPTFYEAIQVMKQEDMASFIQSIENHDCQGCPFKKRCLQTRVNCGDYKKSEWLKMLSQ